MGSLASAKEAVRALGQAEQTLSQLPGPPVSQVDWVRAHDLVPDLVVRDLSKVQNGAGVNHLVVGQLRGMAGVFQLSPDVL